MGVTKPAPALDKVVNVRRLSRSAVDAARDAPHLLQRLESAALGEGW